MIATWMLYGTAVAALLAAGAWVAERTLRLVRRPVRWVWAAAMLLSLLIPLAAWFAPILDNPSDDAGITVEQFVIEPISIEIAPVALDRLPFPLWLDRLDPVLGSGWLIASLLLALGLGLSHLAILRRRRSWRRATFEGVPVLVSRNTGPAAVGFVRPAIVLPEWTREWNASMRRLIVEHEREHIRTRDPLLLIAALVAVVLMPWNAALWWQLRRLRFAVEADCDGRVLRRRPDVRCYGNLLLEVGRVASAGRFALAAFSEPQSFLERRIRMMINPRPRKPLVGMLAFLGVTAVVPVAAFAIPAPDRTPPFVDSTPTVERLPVQTATIPRQIPVPPSETAPSEQEAAAPLDVSRTRLSALPISRPMPSDTPPPEPPTTVAQEPTFTPFEMAPELQNPDELVQAIQANYPDALREAGVGGTVRVWLFINEEGLLETNRLVESSGHPALDEAALEAVRVIQFSPALNQGDPVPVWIQMPITFQVHGARAEGEINEPPSDQPRAEPRNLPSPPATDRRDVAEDPTFTPYEVAPEIQNRDAYLRALISNYPAALRDAGTGGTVRVWLFIDESGTVQDTRIVESSGYPELDQAAIESAGVLEFSPALNRDQPVPAWIQFPVSFQVRETAEADSPS